MVVAHSGDHHIIAGAMRCRARGRMNRAVSPTRILNVSLAVLVALTVWRLAVPHARIATDHPGLHLGDRLDIAGVTWNDASRHVVLMISTTCPWCNKSAELYREISTDLSNQKTVHLVVLHTETRDLVEQWLRDKRIGPTEVARASKPNDIGLSTTPTALIVDSNGRVTDAVIGLMAARDESAFRARYLSVSDARPVTNIPDEIDRSTFVDLLARRSDVQVIDIRDRSDALERKRSALIMPLDEIEVRAPIELASSRKVAIDCSPGWMDRCRLAARLIREHVSDVVVAHP